MRGKTENLKDEVYRQMFRLEESRPGAEMSLALALLRAWLACGLKRENCEERRWLKTLSPICLAMIEAATRAEARHSPARGENSGIY